MASLNKEQLLNTKVFKSEKLYVEALGGSVIVRELSALAVSDYIDLIETEKRMAITHAYLISQSVIDDNGAFIFEGDSLEEVAAMPMNTMKLIVDKAIELSGMDLEDDENSVSADSEEPDENDSAEEETAKIPNDQKEL